jgi:hypothetical protein
MPEEVQHLPQRAAADPHPRPGLPVEALKMITAILAALFEFPLAQAEYVDR